MAFCIPEYVRKMLSKYVWTDADGNQAVACRYCY